MRLHSSTFSGPLSTPTLHSAKTPSKIQFAYNRCTQAEDAQLEPATYHDTLGLGNYWSKRRQSPCSRRIPHAQTKEPGKMHTQHTGGNRNPRQCFVSLVTDSSLHTWGYLECTFPPVMPARAGSTGMLAAATNRVKSADGGCLRLR